MNQTEQTIEAFGGAAAWAGSLPSRHWIMSNDGWCSHDRKRCTDDCEAGIKSALGGDEDSA